MRSGVLQLSCLSSWKKTNTNGRHLDFQHGGAFWWSAVVLYSPNKYWWPPSWFSARGVLLWSTVVLPLLTNTDDRHLYFKNFGAFWWTAIVLPLLSPNKYWWPPTFSARGAFWWTEVVLPLLTNTDGRHLDFQHVVRSGDLQLYFLPKQVLMAAILIFRTLCALVCCSCVTSPNKYW